LQETDLSLLVAAAHSAGDIAKSYFKNAPKSWDKGDGAGPVTEADIAVNTMLEERLRSARPTYGWLSEESLDSDARQGNDAVFIIDPIDGTRSFIEGAQTWAHSIAIARGGVVTSAVVFLPMLNLLYTAGVGEGAQLNGDPIAPSKQADAEGAQILATRPSMDQKHWASDPLPNFDRHHRPSLAYRLSLVAQGRFDGMLTLRPSWEWDIAAGALIVSEAGGVVSTRTGEPLIFNGTDPRLNGVVAAGNSTHIRTNL